MLIKWQKLTVSREQYLTRDSLNSISQSKNDPDYNGANILKGLLKNKLQIPAYVEAEINELEKKLHFFEEEASKPDSKLKDFVSESQISLQLILHTIKNNLEKVKKLEINLLNTVMSKTYIHKLGQETTVTKIELNELIVANEKNMNDTLKNAARWLGEVERFIKLNYPELPPINAGHRQSLSSVAYLLGRIFNTPSATPTPARLPTPSPTSKAVTLDNKKTSFPSIFKPAANNKVTKITGTVDELAKSPKANKNVISPRRIKIEKEKVKTLPNAVSRSKSPRR
jgi:hypothetical protein